MHSQAHTAQKGWVVSRYVDATRARLGSDQGWTWTPAWTYMKYLGITEEGEVEVDGEGNCTINFAEAATHVLLKSLHMHSQQRRTPAQRTATTNTLDADKTYAEDRSHNERQRTHAMTVAYNNCT